MTGKALKALSDAELREVAVMALEEIRARAEKHKQDMVAKGKTLDGGNGRRGNEKG